MNRRFLALAFWTTALILVICQRPAPAQSYSSSPGTVSTTWTVGGPGGLAYPKGPPSAGQVLVATSPTAAAWATVPGCNNPGALTTTDWYIDAATGNDANNGTSSGTPLATASELGRRWCSWSPTLNQATIIHAGAGGIADPFVVTPKGSGSLVIQGTMSSAWTGTVASLTAKSRAGNQLLKIASVTGMAPYQLVFNSTRNAYAIVYTVGGGFALMSQSLGPAAPPGTLTGSELDTWANGDAIVGETLPSVDVRGIGFAGTGGTTNGTTVYHCTVPNTIYLTDFGHMVESTAVGAVSVSSQQTTPTGSNTLSNSGFEALLTASITVNTSLSLGGVANTSLKGGVVYWILGSFFFSGDTILATNTGLKRHNVGGNIIADGLYGDTQLVFTYGLVQMWVPFWGSSKMVVGSGSYPGSIVGLVGTAASLFLSSGGVGFAGTSIGYGWDPTIAGYDQGVTVTPANLDAEFTAGRVGVFGTTSFSGITNGATISSPATGGVAGVLASAHGGTGVASPTAHAVLIAEGASPMIPVGLGDAQLLVGQTAADPAPKTMSGDSTMLDTGAVTNTGLLTKALPALANGYLNYTGSAWALTGLPTSLPPSGPAGGRLAGTYPNPTLAASGVTAATYGSSSTVPVCAISADGTASSCTNTTIAAPLASATGTLPSGALSGAYSGLTGTGALTSGSTAAGFTVNFSSSTLSGTVPDANQACQTLSGGDVGGTTCAPVVNKISGSSPIAITPNDLQWVAGATPLISQVTPGAGVSGHIMEITGQNGGSGVTGGAPVFIAGGAGSGGGGAGYCGISAGDFSYEIAAQPNGVIISGSQGNLLAFDKNVSTPIFEQLTPTSDVPTQELVISAQSAFASASTNKGGGVLLLEGGQPASGGAGGAVGVQAGDGASNLIASPNAVVGNSGGLTETVVHNLTVAGSSTASKRFDEFAKTDTGTSGLSTTAVAAVALANGHSALLRCHGIANITTAGGSMSVGDSFEESKDILFNNLGGTMNLIGAPVGVSRVISGTFNSASTAVSANLLGATPGCILLAQPSSGTGMVFTATVWGEVFYN